jgi:ribosome-associated protein
MIDQERPSKTQRKKQMHDLQTLGERLVTLNAVQLDSIGLPEGLRTAVAEAQGIPARESRRRQLQYIGRLMRDVDPEPILEKIAAWDGLSHEHTARLHGIERWRDRLLEDETAMEEFLRECPGADSQRLRSLVRNARAERDASRPPKSYRELFRLLRDILEPR